MRTVVLALLLLACVPAAAFSQQPVATIDGEPVFAAEVTRELDDAYRGRKIDEEQKRLLLARAREQVIDRRMILRRLVRKGEAASQDDVGFALAKLEKQLTAQNITLADHCKQIGLTEQEIRQTLLWKLSWQRYLTRYQTDENLHKYFDRHRRDFDGTQLRVAHILIKPSEPEDAALAKATEQIEVIRAQIAAGKTTFAEAAKVHSAGPSAKDGGDIGWIERHQPMPESFSAAAFALDPGEVSPPVTTTFGVHLIQVLEVKSGTQSWQDAAERLKPAVALYLFRWLADQERTAAKIERAADWPP